MLFVRNVGPGKTAISTKQADIRPVGRYISLPDWYYLSLLLAGFVYNIQLGKSFGGER